MPEPPVVDGRMPSALQRLVEDYLASCRARGLSSKTVKDPYGDSAYRLFSEDGYPSTTMDAIATEAGVAVQTVYHVFNTKAELVREVIQVAAAGRHDPPPEPAWLQEAFAAKDGRRALALSTEHGFDMSARVAPLIAAINAAASTDPSFAEYWDASCTVRRNGVAQIVERLAASGHLCAGLGTQRAADILYATGSHETLSAFLTICGWSLEEVKAWYYEMACNQLLSEEAGRDLPPGGLKGVDLAVTPRKGGAYLQFKTRLQKPLFESVSLAPVTPDRKEGVGQGRLADSAHSNCCLVRIDV